MAKTLNSRDGALIDAGFVPASVCARWGAYNLSSIHRAVVAGTLTGQRVGRRLYVKWATFRQYVGPLAAQLPETARAAVDGESC